MKSLVKQIPIALILLSVVFGKELELGSSIPLADLKMREVSGKELSLGEVAGSKGLVVIFSCNTCPYVVAWEDRYVELANTYQPKDVGFIAVNSNEAYRKKGDSYKDMQARAKKLGYTFYYALDEDSELAQAFGATRTPHIFVFDADKKLVYRGAIDDNANQPEKVEETYLADALDASLAGEPVKLASTKALGCTIKFED
jgi:thiol-disulfide isomerase/thioredoxin